MPDRRFALAACRERMPYLEKLLIVPPGSTLALVVQTQSDSTGIPLGEYAKDIHRYTGQYQGRWVALRDGAVLDSDKSGLDLKRRLSAQGHLTGILFIHFDT